MNELTVIGKKYGTDKAGPQHNYTEVVYYKMLEKARYNKIKLLELGAGDTGASHKMWREFLPNAEIVLFDPFFINYAHPTSVIREGIENLGIKVVVGNQLSNNDLQKLCLNRELEESKFDIIIDDASHVSDAIQNSFGVLFPYLKKGGIYIVEDLYCVRDRDSRIHDVNSWIDGPYVKQELEKFYHKRDIHLLDSLSVFLETGKYISNFLTNDQKSYIEKNIDYFQVFEDYNDSENLVVITKKE